MRRLVVGDWMSVDGVAQAPGLPDEDRSGGFAHGGWSIEYFDEVAQRWVQRGLESSGGFVLGRRTYEILAAYWPNASEEERGLADPLNTLPKYVASTTLSEPLGWENSSLLGADVADAVSELKREDGGDLNVIGSSDLLETLIAHDLVDEYRLMIDPLLLGGGKRLFPEDGVRRPLRLVGTETTSTGAIIATYERVGG